MMKIAHFSDTHIGFAAYDAVDPDIGVNRRELDFYEAFARAIDAILAERPELVIHAGDLYDSVRPQNRAITVCMEGFARLSKAGITTVVVAGNHETPRIRTTGSILRALGTLPHIYPVYDGQYRALEFGGAVVHAVSDAPSDTELQVELTRVKAVSAKVNILATHGGLKREHDRIDSGEYNEHLFPPELLARLADFDYIALGHYHSHHRVLGTKNAWYSGSTERTSFSQVSYTPGFVTVELSTGKPQHHPIEVREMRVLPTIDAKGLGPGEVLEAISKAIRHDTLDGILLRVVVENLSSAARAGLDTKRLRELARASLHVEWDLRVRDEERRGGAELTIQPLEKEFEEFMRTAKPEGDRERLTKIGLDYLARVCAEEASDED